MREHRMYNEPGYPWRREKRFHRRGMGDGGVALYDAWNFGCWAGQFRRSKCNPYPPGRRHDEWQRGYDVTEKGGGFWR